MLYIGSLTQGRRMQIEKTDNELIVLFRNPVTKEKAFTAIVNRYKEKLYWHIRRILVIHEDADDVLQNVFIKVWNGLENFREDCRLYTWLYRICTNETITYLEALKKRKAINFNNTNLNPEERIKADAHFDAGKIEWKLQLAIQQLPPQQKIVFNLRYFDEMPYSEMSGILNVSEGSLKASYHHAAKKIEAWLLNH